MFPRRYNLVGLGQERKRQSSRKFSEKMESVIQLPIGKTDHTIKK